MQSKNIKRLSILAILLMLLAVTPISAQSIPRHYIGNALAAKLTVNGTSTLTGAVTSSGRVTVGSVFGLTPATGIVVTMNSTITPLGTYQPISSAGTVNTSSITAGTAGDRLTLVNTAANSIVFTDTGTLKLTGNITLGQFDTLDMISDGTNWIMTGTSNN